MHEMGIVKDLVKAVLEQIKDARDIKRIKKIYVRLGRSAEVTEDILKFWFENLSRGTKLEGAALEVSIGEGRGIVIDTLEVEEL